MKKNSISKHANEPLLRLCYMTLLLLSGETNIELTYHNLADRYFIDKKTAQRIIALLENFVCEDINSNIALEGASYDAIHRSPHAEAFWLPELKLTQRESTALLGSLISTGLENSNPTLEKIKHVVSSDVDVDDILRQNYTADHTSHHAISPWMVAVCCLSKRRFTFDYRTREGDIKGYTVDPLYIMYKEERWYMNAWDIEADKQKFFLLSKMKNLAPTQSMAEEHDYIKRNSFTFDGVEKNEVTFKNGKYFYLVGHSTFEDIANKQGDIVALHDSSQPYWLAKQVAASGGNITTNSESVQEEAKKYAYDLLEKARRV